MAERCVRLFFIEEMRIAYIIMELSDKYGKLRGGHIHIDLPLLVKNWPMMLGSLGKPALNMRYMGTKLRYLSFPKDFSMINTV